jgi:hypothetical protein
VGGIWDFGKGTGLSWADVKIMVHKGPVYKAWVHQDHKDSNPIYINQSISINLSLGFTKDYFKIL